MTKLKVPGGTDTAVQSPGDLLASVVVVPRLLRFRDAPRYLGMDKNRFNREVRPHVTVIPIGKQGIAFDRLDLDAWVDEYKGRKGRPVANSQRSAQWDKRSRQASPNAARSGTSTKMSTERAFARALAQAISKKP